MALAKDIEFDNEAVTLHPEFRAKAQPSVSSYGYGSIRVPRLTTILDHNDDYRFLCPVRSLKEYLSRTAPLRLSQRRLFVSQNPKYTKDISKATVSRW